MDQPPTPLPPAAEPPAAEPALRQQGPATLTLFVLLVAAALTSLLYRLLVRQHLEQGVALFIGMPLLLGTVVAFQTFPRSPFGMVLKVTALCLCIVAPLLGEGAVCIAMAAPLIFAVLGLGALIGRIIQRSVGKNRAGCVGLLVALSPMLWDHAEKLPGWEDDRPIEEVTDGLDLKVPTARAWAALAEALADLSAAPIPAFLQLRRRPGERRVTGAGLQIGDERRIRFDNDSFVGTVVAMEPGRSVRFAVREETAAPGERIGLWIRFVTVDLTLSPLPDGGSRLLQRTRYRRLLDPGFYFGPLERHGVHAMHRYTLALFSQRAHR